MAGGNTAEPERNNLMGFVHDTHFAQSIPIEAMSYVTGTWAPVLASNVLSMDKTAGDESTTIYIPIMVPSNASALKGAKLKSVDVHYHIGTAAADDFATVELEKVTFEADGTIPTGEAVTTTEDAAHDTAAERKAADDHKMTVSVTTPEWVDNDVMHYLTLIIDCAAGTVLKLYGAVANYELRA
jgi:hypothetical protein